MDVYASVEIPERGIQCERAITVILLCSPESNNPGWPTGVALWTKMKCLQDQCCRTAGYQNLSLIYVYWILSTVTVDTHYSVHTSTLLLHFSINYNKDCRLERHTFHQMAYWHFYGHDFVSLLLSIYYFKDWGLFNEWLHWADGITGLWSNGSHPIKWREIFFFLAYLTFWDTVGYQSTQLHFTA